MRKEVRTVRKSRFLIRLLVFGLVVASLPTVTIGLLSYWKSSAIVQGRVEEADRLLVSQTESHIDQSMQATDSSSTESISIIHTEEMLRRSWNNRYDDYVDFTNLQHALTSIKFPGLMTTSQLFSLTNHWLMSDQGFDVSTARDTQTKEMATQKLKRIDQNTVWTSDEDRILLLKKVPLFVANPAGILVVSVPRSEFEAMIGLDRRLGSFTILDQEERVVYSQADLLPGSDLQALPFVAKIRGSTEASGVFTANFEGRLVRVIFQKSPYSGWTFMSVIDIKDMRKDSRAIAWYTLWGISILLAVSLLVVWFGSRRVYGPIARLYRTVLSSADPGSTGGDELQVIGDNVRHILTQQSQMKVQLREQFMLKLLRGEAKPEEIRERWRQFAFPEQWELICVAAFQMDEFERSRYEEKDSDLLLFAANNMIGELLPVDLRLPPTIVGNFAMTVIGFQENDPTSFKRSLFEQAAKIQDAVQAYLSLKISIGFSRIYSSTMEIARACKEGLEVLKYKDRLGEVTILFMQDIIPEQPQRFRYPAELVADLLDAVKLAQDEQAQHFLHLFVQAVFAVPMAPAQYQMQLLRLVTELNALLQELNLNLASDVHGEKVEVEQLLQLRTTLEIERWLTQSFLQPAMQQLVKRRKQQVSTLSEEVKRIIHLEFDTELTLEACAHRVNYSAKYVGKVFREETGMAFSDYLSEYRLDIAMQWLKESSLTVTEIAQRLQFHNVANFIRAFRRSTGITPGKFREQYGQRGI